MSDLWKCFITALITFTLTMLALWLVIIKEHQYMAAQYESLIRQQTKRWEIVSDQSERIAKLEARWEYLESQ